MRKVSAAIVIAAFALVQMVYAIPLANPINQPTLLARYDGPDFNQMAYHPRQFATGLNVDSVGRHVTNPSTFTGWDSLQMPATGSGIVSTNPSWLTLTLNRPALLGVVWVDAATPPSWLSSFAISGTVGINNATKNVYVKSVAAGSVVLGGVCDSACSPRAMYDVILAEAGGTPSLAPSIPDGLIAPAANQLCPDWVHDQYVTTGPDGNTYPTWHPQIDPVYWCYFSHEHGVDPSTFDASYKPAYGYTAAQHGMVEPHTGFKSYVFDEGPYVWMITHHFGTNGAGRFCQPFHTTDIAVKDRSTGEVVADTHQMMDFGKAVVNRTGVPLTPPGCPDQAITLPVNDSGVRQIPSVADGAVGYEPWRSNGNEAVRANGLVNHSLVFFTRDSILICNTSVCDAPVVRGAGYSGTSRYIEYQPGFGFVATPGASGVFYTDPHGGAIVNATDPGATYQYIKPGWSYQAGNASNAYRCWIAAWGGKMACPNNTEVVTERERSIGTGPN